MMPSKRSGDANRGWFRRNIQRIASVRNDFLTARRHAGTFAGLHAILSRIHRYLLGRLPWLSYRVGKLNNGVLFVGYVEAGLGLGEALRGLIGAVATTPLPFAIYPFNVGVEARFINFFMPDRYDRKGRYSVNLIYMATDQLPAMFGTLGKYRLRGGYNILRTYWELAEAPKEWIPNLVDIDEIWAPSVFVANAFRGIFDGPITTIPTCVDISCVTGPDRGRFDMAADRFYFIYSFDYFSTPARKNPLGALRAFQEAFPDQQENVGLIIKSGGGIPEYNAIRAEISRAASDDGRIIVIDEILSRSMMVSLLASSDCYLSMHRSEGFGLGMAEAMALGKVVIGTNYSGNTDFLSDSTGFPIPYQLQPVRPGSYPYAEAQLWAEPDLQAAARLMRCVYGNPDERQMRAGAGKAFVHAHYSRASVAKLAGHRLDQILERRSARESLSREALMKNH